MYICLCWDCSEFIPELTFYVFLFLVVLTFFGCLPVSCCLRYLAWALAITFSQNNLLFWNQAFFRWKAFDSSSSNLNLWNHWLHLFTCIGTSSKVSAMVSVACQEVFWNQSTVSQSVVYQEICQIFFPPTTLSSVPLSSFYISSYTTLKRQRL